MTAATSDTPSSLFLLAGLAEENVRIREGFRRAVNMHGLIGGSAMPKREQVPKQLQPIYDEITAITDAFCAEHLNDEYAQLSRKLAAALSRKRPSPLLRGKVTTWACGIVYALGSVNFLSDRSFEPFMRLEDICADGRQQEQRGQQGRRDPQAARYVPV